METVMGMFQSEMQKAAINRLNGISGLQEFVVFFKPIIAEGKIHEVVAEYAAFPHLMSEDEIAIMHSDNVYLKELIALAWLTLAKHNHVLSVCNQWLHERPELWEKMRQNVLNLCAPTKTTLENM